MTSEPQVPVTEEADIFEALGLTYRPPEQRESLGTQKKRILNRRFCQVEG